MSSRKQVRAPAEEVDITSGIDGEPASAAKADVGFAGFMRGLKTPASLRIEFFRKLKSPVDSGVSVPGINPWSTVRTSYPAACFVRNYFKNKF